MLGVGCGEQRQLGSKQTYKALPGGPRRNLFRWKGTDRGIIKLNHADLRRQAR